MRPWLGAIVAVSLLIGGMAITWSALPDNAIRVKRRVVAESPSRDEPAAVPIDPAQDLMEAAQYADAKLLESLLARGVDRKTLNRALFVAARSEPLVLGASGQQELDLLHAATVRLLLSRGASVRARDEDGTAPLAVAARKGETAVVKLLIEKGAEIDARDNSGATALIAAACTCPIIDQPETDGSVELLLAGGANIEASDKEGRTALMAAAAWGRESIVKILLDRGAKIETKDKRGNTALLIAAEGGGYPTADAVKMLFARGANIKARNNHGETALMLAASNGGYEDIKIVEMLINRGADLQAKNSDGLTAIELAVAKKRDEIVLRLRSATR